MGESVRGAGGGGGVHRTAPQTGKLSKFQKGVKTLAKAKAKIKAADIKGSLQAKSLQKRTAEAPLAAQPRTTPREASPVAPLKPYSSPDYREVHIRSQADFDVFVTSPPKNEKHQPIKLVFDRDFNFKENMTIPKEVNAVTLPPFQEVSVIINFEQGSQCREFSCANIGKSGEVNLPSSIENVTVKDVDGTLSFQRGSSCQRIKANNVNATFFIPTNTQSVECNNLGAPLVFQPNAKLTHFKASAVMAGVSQELPTATESVSIPAIMGDVNLPKGSACKEFNVSILQESGSLVYPRGTQVTVQINRGRILKT